MFDHKNYQQSKIVIFSRNRNGACIQIWPNMVSVTKYGFLYQTKECMLKNVLARCQCWPAFIQKYNQTCKKCTLVHFWNPLIWVGFDTPTHGYISTHKVGVKVFSNDALESGWMKFENFIACDWRFGTPTHSNISTQRF